MQSDVGGSWFSDDSFWTDYASLLFGPERWAEVPSVVDAILSLAGKTPPGVPCHSGTGADPDRDTPYRHPGAVLDVCCGPGRHALEFARRGWTTTGIDLTPQYIAAAAESADAMGVPAEFIEADARTWERPEAFDLAINLFTSFGYFEDEEDDLCMLAAIYRSLRPGGVLVLDLVGKELAVRDFTEGEWFERDGRIVLTAFSVVGPWEYLRNRWIILDGNRRTDRTWDQRLYSATELVAVLKKAGFTDVRIYGSWDGSPYDRQADRLVAVALKSGTA